MFEQLISRRGEHIPPHRFWGFKESKFELAREEYAHFFECRHCHEVMEIFFNSETFGEALLTWSKHHAREHTAA
jgi:hypothetical protein